MARPLENRTYFKDDCVVFLRTADEFGGLSNMAGGYPLSINGVRVLTSEALYQACRFPHLPDVQKQIIEQASPMTAKMKSRIYHADSRSDWMAVRVRIMRWCLRVKLAQNWDRFGFLLLSTGNKPIVEFSKRDPFWGASPTNNEKLEGINVLGRLLMELREQLRGEDKKDLLCVPPLDIPQFLLYGEPIDIIRGDLNNADSLTHKESDKPDDAWLRAIEAKTEEVPLVPQQSELNTGRAKIEAEQVKSTEKYPKRLIEVDLPIKRISAHARREKSIRHGHISTLHIWWARRPLAACRAVICAALWFDPADEDCPPKFREAVRREMRKWARDSRGLMSAESYDHFEAVQKKSALLDDDKMLRTLLLDFIADFANWDNSTNKQYLETSRALTEAAHIAAGGEPGTRPLVVDPFAGGGTIPLEALRVGADAFASDLNPVAALLNKVMLEYVPRYGQELADEVRKWGAWVKERAEKELAEFYPKDPDGATPIAYLWARTIVCEGPGCGAEVPLIRSLSLESKGSRSTALRIIRDRKNKRIDFEIIENAKVSDIGEGTVRRSSCTCPLCGYTTPADKVRNQFIKRDGGADDAKLLAVVIQTDSDANKKFRPASERDMRSFKNAAKHLKHKMQAQNGIPIVPNEPLPYLRSIFNVNLLGIDEWGKLFNRRQCLALVTLIEKTKEAIKEAGKSSDKNFSIAVGTCLALAVDRCADYWSSLAVWAGDFVAHTFGRQALGIIWDYAEVSGFSGGSGGYAGAIEWIYLCLKRESTTLQYTGQIELASACEHPLPDDSAQAFVTDPPYYDAVPYADLSDFFYVWLKRSIGEYHETLFDAELTPKRGEVVQLSERNPAYAYKTQQYFEDSMKSAMSEGRRLLQPNGIGIVVFAHKSTVGWETQINAMIDAGWVVTGSWAIDTERPGRLRANNAAALASSIHLVCRPRENADGSLSTEDIGDWRDVLRELPVRIHEWMPRLSKEGIVGADAIFACLGPALEVFSRYSRVEKASGEQVPLREYLEYVWAAVAKEALTLIFAGETDADVTGFEEDARLTAMWLWTLFAGAKPEDDKQGSNGDAEGDSDDEEPSGKSAKQGGFTLEYDAARKIAQGLGAHLEELTQLVEVKGDKARLLPVAERTKHLFGKEEADSPHAARKKKDKQAKLFDTLDDVEVEMGGWGDKSAPQIGDTVLDRVHQAMILFAAGRGDAMKRFLVDDGVGNDERFWRLANALSALYPSGGDEKRWVDGVLARKKGLGF